MFYNKNEPLAVSKCPIQLKHFIECWREKDMQFAVELRVQLQVNVSVVFRLQSSTPFSTPFG